MRSGELSAESCTYLLKDGLQMPVRKIPSLGAQKNIGKFSSVKMGRVAWYESLLERDYMYLLDHDLTLSYWVEQPLKIRYGDNGRTRSYTPDFEVHRQSKKQIVEVKTKDQVDSGEWDALFSTASSICEKEGYEFTVVTDEFIRQQPRLDNVKTLWKYARTPIRARHQILCNEFFREKQVAEIELGEFIQFFRVQHVPVQTIYALLFWSILNFDVTQPLNGASIITLPSTEVSATTNWRLS
jgi:hypothetical protein